MVYTYGATVFPMFSGGHGFCKICGQPLQKGADGEYDRGSLGIYFCQVAMHPECLHDLGTKVFKLIDDMVTLDLTPQKAKELSTSNFGNYYRSIDANELNIKRGKNYAKFWNKYGRGTARIRRIHQRQDRLRLDRDR